MKEATKRYRQVLLPCDYTQKSNWGKAVAQGDKLLDIPIYYESWEMLWEIHDTKTGKKYSPEEYRKICNDLNSKGIYGQEDFNDRLI